MKLDGNEAVQDKESNNREMQNMHSKGKLRYCADEKASVACLVDCQLHSKIAGVPKWKLANVGKDLEKMSDNYLNSRKRESRDAENCQCYT